MLTFSPVPKITSDLDLAASRPMLASGGRGGGWWLRSRVEKRKLEGDHVVVEPLPSVGMPCGQWKYKCRAQCEEIDGDMDK